MCYQATSFSNLQCNFIDVPDRVRVDTNMRFMKSKWEFLQVRGYCAKLGTIVMCFFLKGDISLNFKICKSFLSKCLYIYQDTCITSF